MEVSINIPMDELCRIKNLTRAEDIKKEDLKERIGKLSPLSAECCIYRVPKRLRKIKAEAYTPQLVSIGPLHHGKESLSAMEEHKLRYLQSFLVRTSKGMEYYVNAVKEWEERARDSYAETIKFESEEFVEMIIVDGVFIINELFLRSDDCSLRNDTDRIFDKPWMLDDLLEDMILLENQLPFFVLEDLFNLAFGGDAHGSFIQLSHNSLKSLSINEDPNTISSNSKVMHFVDLLRNYCLPSSSMEIPDDVKEKIGFRRSATELHKAGVEFEKCTSNSFLDLDFGFRRSATELHEAGVEFEKCTSNSFLDLDFIPTTGVLKIPQFRIDDRTECILRNLHAFEQCHHLEDRYISDYIYLMNGLINTTKDLELLAEKKIINNWLGDNESAATLFNELGSGNAVTNSTYYSRLCEQLNKYHEVTWHAWWATLKRDYFGTPLRTASTLAAIFLILLTLVQTICSIISAKCKMI